jgi:hypothetical protein
MGELQCLFFLNLNLLRKFLWVFCPDDQANFLKLYRAACSEASCPKSDRLTQLILRAATAPSARPEVAQPALAILQTLGLQGLTANPFSGNPGAQSASATSLRIGHKFGIKGNPYILAEDIYMGIYAPTDAEGNSWQNLSSFCRSAIAGHEDIQ